MKNIFRRGSDRAGKSKILGITAWSICMYIVCIVAITVLFLIDTDSNNLTPMKTFMDNENKYLYNNKYESLQFEDSDKYMHSIGFDYMGTRLDAQFSDLMGVITDLESTIDKPVDSLESAEEFVNNLIPESIVDANNWTKMFINKYAYYDLLSVIDPNCEDYWEIRCYALDKIILHSSYRKVNFYAFLYDNMISLVMCFIQVIIITFSLDAGYLVVYFCRVYKMKGAKRNDVHTEA